MKNAPHSKVVNENFARKFIRIIRYITTFFQEFVASPRN